jgi:hypothetical protein
MTSEPLCQAVQPQNGFFGQDGMPFLVRPRVNQRRRRMILPAQFERSESIQRRKAKMLNVCNWFRMKGVYRTPALGSCLFTDQSLGAKTINRQKQ